MKKYRESKHLQLIDKPDKIKNTLSIDTSVPKKNCKIVNIDKYKKIPDLPDNFSLYKESDCFYLSFSKVINKKRYNKKLEALSPNFIKKTV